MTEKKRAKPRNPEEAVQTLKEHSKRCNKVREVKVGKGDDATYLYLITGGEGIMSNNRMTLRQQELLGQFAKLYVVAGVECFLDRVSGEQQKAQAAQAMAALVAEYHTTFEALAAQQPEDENDAEGREGKHSGTTEGEGVGEVPRRKSRVSAHEVEQRLGGKASRFQGQGIITPDDPGFAVAEQLIEGLEAEGLGLRRR